MAGQFPIERQAARPAPPAAVATAVEARAAIQHAAAREAAPVPAAERPSPQPIALGAAVIDRLAEDVMQRIERRMRIERERRGL